MNKKDIIIGKTIIIKDTKYKIVSFRKSLSKRYIEILTDIKIFSLEDLM